MSIWSAEELANLRIKVGDTIRFKYKGAHHDGIVDGITGKQYSVSHPNGRSWSIWEEDIVTKLVEFKWPGIYSWLQAPNQPPGEIATMLEFLYQIGNKEQCRAVQTLLKPFKYKKQIDESDT